MQKVYSTLINSCDLLSKSYLQQRKVNSNAQFRGCDLLSKSYLQQLRWQIKKEVNIEHQYPDTLTNIKPNWAKINDTYQLIQVKDSVFQPRGFYLEKDNNGDDLLFSKAGPVIVGYFVMSGSEMLRVLQELSHRRPYHTKHIKVK